MKVLKLSILFCGVTSVSSAFSNSPSTANPKVFDLNQYQTDLLSLGDDSSSCFNVGGTWKGVCDVKSIGAAGSSDQEPSVVQTPTVMTFSQKGCALIQAEQFGSSYLGAVKSETVSNQRGVLSQTGAAYWLANGSKLGMNQSFSLVMYGDRGSLSIGKVQGDFYLDGQSLVGKVTQSITQRTMNGQFLGTISIESNCRLIRE